MNRTIQYDPLIVTFGMLTFDNRDKHAWGKKIELQYMFIYIFSLWYILLDLFFSSIGLMLVINNGFCFVEDILKHYKKI